MVVSPSVYGVASNGAVFTINNQIDKNYEVNILQKVLWIWNLFFVYARVFPTRRFSGPSQVADNKNVGKLEILKA